MAGVAAKSLWHTMTICKRTAQKTAVHLLTYSMYSTKNRNSETVIWMKDRQFGEVSEKTRKNMQKIRSKDTSIEVALRKRLWHDGYRYRKNYKKLPGSPDIAIMKHKIAVFCDSEFFHGKEWDRLKTRLERGKNPQYWIKHIEENMERDRRVEKELEALDWTVIRFWGNDIKKDLEGCLQVIEC